MPEGIQDGIIVADLVRLRLDHDFLDKRWLSYVINAQDVSAQLKTLTKGTTRPRVNLTHIRELRLYVPPLNEQRRIVAKIEELFSELDKGIESLKAAREQLKVYRQAVLKNAFEGKLTVHWREENQDKLETSEQLLERIKREREAHYQRQLEEWNVAVREWESCGKRDKRPIKPRLLPPPSIITPEEAANICTIPSGWIWIRPEDVASPLPYSIGIGPFGSNLKVSDYRDTGVPLIFVRNITRSDFKLDLKYIEYSKFLELKAHVVEPLDILITKMGDPPGDCEIYPEDAQVAVLTADCLKFRVWEKFVERKFYNYCLQSNHVKKQLGLITKGVAQKKISVDRFKTLALPLTTLEEQTEIVRIVETILSSTDRIDREIETQLAKAETLRQSILKKAFSGKLVPQDANDEPASVLLERIRTQKYAQQSNGRQPRKKRKTA